MIISRYLFREVIATSISISIVLLGIVLSIRFIKYLDEVALGILDLHSLIFLILLRIPELLELILPLSLLLGILMSYGRLSSEYEMIALTTSGISQYHILGITMLPSSCIALFVACLSLYFTPEGINQSNLLVKKESSVNRIMVGKFYSLKNYPYVTYIRAEDRKLSQYHDVFIVEDKNKDSISTLYADTAIVKKDKQGDYWLILKNGSNYTGVPGDSNYRLVNFETLGVKLGHKTPIKKGFSSLPTLDLIKTNNLAATAELQWRLSLPVSVFIIAILAVPLSRVDSRTGRFLRLLPATFTYLGYLSILSWSREALKKGTLNPTIGLWWVNGLLLIIALSLITWKDIRLKVTYYLNQRNIF